MVKANQPTLKEEIAAIWNGGPLPQPQVADTWQHGGRVEQRRLWASGLLVGYSDWPHLAQVCRLERTVWTKNGTRKELAYAVTSLSPDQGGPDRLLTLWRGHWGIENRVHWVRDVTMDEDRSQVRTGSAPRLMAAFRNTAINLLRLASEPNIAAALRRCASQPLTLVGASSE